MTLLVVAAGGALGAISRYLASGWVQDVTGDFFMRIFLGEADRCGSVPYKGKPLYEAILLMLREEGCAGATVVRAIAGFGASTRLHTGKVLRLSADLPIIVEVVDEADKLQTVLPKLDKMMGGGLVTMERAEVILYRGASSDE